MLPSRQTQRFSELHNKLLSQTAININNGYRPQVELIPKINDKQETIHSALSDIYSISAFLIIFIIISFAIRQFAA